jgi:hypothetical protein
MRKHGTKFNTLKEATDAMLVMDFDKVIAYKITFKNAPTGNYWIVSRKILTNFPMGAAQWSELVA